MDKNVAVASLRSVTKACHLLLPWKRGDVIQSEIMGRNADRAEAGVRLLEKIKLNYTSINRIFL